MTDQAPDDITAPESGRRRSPPQSVPDDTILHADDLMAGYLPGINILNGADLYCQRGELVGVIGPNGAG
ncbi:MAG: hypothetical protein ACRDP2_05085, partial [Nocardioidaceae bacterium]